MARPCQLFRPHPWRQGVCTECFCQKSEHKSHAANDQASTSAPDTTCNPVLKSHTRTTSLRPSSGQHIITSRKQRISLAPKRCYSTAENRPGCPVTRSLTTMTETEPDDGELLTRSGQPTPVSTESGFSTNESMSASTSATLLSQKECCTMQISQSPSPSPSTVLGSSSTIVRTFSLEDMASPELNRCVSSSGSSPEQPTVSGHSIRASISADSSATPILSTQEQEDFLNDLSLVSDPSSRYINMKTTSGPSPNRNSVPLIVFSENQKKQQRRQKGSFSDANRRAFSETDLWEKASGQAVVEASSDVDGQSAGGSNSSKSSLKRLIKKVMRRGSHKESGSNLPSKKRSSESSQTSKLSRDVSFESDSTASDISSALSPGLSPKKENNFERLLEYQEMPNPDSVVIARRHYARGASSWDQAYVPPERLQNFKGTGTPVHQACVYPYRRRHTRHSLKALSDETVIVTGNSCYECSSPTCEVAEHVDTGSPEIVAWDDYFEAGDVNPVIDEELNSTQSGLRAVWDKSLELVTKPLPSLLAKAAADWDNLELIGHDTGQYPSTNYAHLEYIRDGARKAFSMEIDMGVPVKHMRISPLLRDSLIRESMAEHFNILQARVRISQRLPIGIECQMDVAVSDSVQRNCYVTDFLGNYVSGYTFVSLCLMGKDLKEYEERVILLILQLLLALEHAHNHGIVHRCVELDKILVGTVDGLNGDRLLLNGFEYALSAGNDKRVKVEPTSHPPADWFVYNVNELLYLGCNIAHLPPEIIGLCDSSPQLDFSRVDAYAAGVFISELLEVFRDNHTSVLHYISKAMMAPAPTIRLTLAKARRILECWLWGPRCWLQKGNSSDSDISFSRLEIKRWLANRQTALLGTVALRSMLGQLTVGDVLHCHFLSATHTMRVQSAGEWLRQLVRNGRI